MTTPIQNEAEFARLAKSLIANPDNWIQGHLHYMKSDGTRCYCSMGAIGAAGSVAMWERGNDFNQVGQFKMGVNLALTKVMNHIPSFNDSHSHAEVMKAWDEAIAICDERVAKAGTV